MTILQSTSRSPRVPRTGEVPRGRPVSFVTEGGRAPRPEPMGLALTGRDVGGRDVRRSSWLVVSGDLRCEGDI